MVILESLILGLLISIMIFCNGLLSKYMGAYLSIVIIHIIGLIGISFILLITKQKIRLNKTIPIYLYIAGALGVIMVLFNNLAFNALGVSLTLVMGLLGQFITSLVVEHYGLFGMKKNRFKKEKLIGLIIITIGIYLMIIY